MIEHADDALEWSPPWTIALIDYMVETRGATIVITGDAEPELLADLDQRRAQRARPRIAVEKPSTPRTSASSSGRSSAIPMRAGPEPCSASPTWSASGGRHHRDAPRRAPIRSPPGRCTSRDSGNVRRRWKNASARSAWGRDRPAHRPPCPSLADGSRDDGRGHLHIVNVPTEEVFTTLIAGSPKAPCARRSRSRSGAASSVASRCASSGEGPSRYVPSPGPTPCGRRWPPTRVRLPGRGRPRRRRLTRSQDRRRLLRHALRRERGLSHRCRARASRRWTAARR